ncbi:NAD-dependent epimerase/dehydratase family protein [bacterium]|nr:NAD-dependent epimerase/dehydratase family protein [bacterium]
MTKILVTGALGQIGSELVNELRRRYGRDNVLASDIRDDVGSAILESGPYKHLDCLNKKELIKTVQKFGVDTIYHLGAILSGVGELHPDLAWDVNMNGLKNILDTARDLKLTRVMVPSSIAVFGPTTPVDNTPQETLLRPTSMYGVTKVAGELLCEYYWIKYGVDVRGLRYPGLISYKTPPGGGTTDYAVAIYIDAIKHGKYECFVTEETMLPMMYMPDAIKAIIQLAEADGDKLRYRNAYNLAAFSFSAGELAASIRKHIHEFEVEYKPDYHQPIADSWPNSIDDTGAQKDWNWKPEYDLETMTVDMLTNLREMLGDEAKF